MTKSKATHDASDPGAIRKAEDQEKDRERDLQWILSKPRGRRFLHDLVYDTCHIGLRSHCPGDSETTAFNEGARSVGEAILEKIRSEHFDEYLLMQKEFRGDE